jgi:lipid-A-disaccharide synthase
VKIALVAGEPSGDVLGAGLIAALRQHYPQAQFVGIGGQLMCAQGLVSAFPLERLSVMGLVEVFAHLPELLHIQKALLRQFTDDPPAVFIGIDAPDFNLRLERRLRASGIPTVQYVSPQVWAWRPWRVRKIARAIDLMLTLLPFEAAFYQSHGIPVSYVGHPLADDIPFNNDRQSARQTLGLAVDTSPCLALLPGSRLSEVKLLTPVFAATASWLRERKPELRVIMAVATPRIRAYVAALLAQQALNLPVQLFEGCSRTVMTAADVVLLASGTATLEAMLLKRPMVVGYKMNAFTAWIVSRLINIPHYALPNLLAEQRLVPEFMQAAATVDNLGPAVLRFLDQPAACARLDTAFSALHHQLRCDASAQAAAAVSALLSKDRQREHS